VIVSSGDFDYLFSVLKNKNKKSLGEGETTMKQMTWTMIISLILQALLAVAVNAQSGKPQFGAKSQGAPAQNAAVNGGGSPGRISKWAGAGSNSYVLGDSNIFEDKFGIAAQRSRRLTYGFIYHSQEDVNTHNIALLD
jgi:hypothetical protein